ncbi:WXG100 family type VII secretion target [Kitasatospora sp. NPDC059795]|uniref:WXG100 family type VII secretion target n=1 Tax=Kitasatospora sp. NPDC059795 TaxID=3346949 RepID=UPI003667553D
MTEMTNFTAYSHGQMRTMVQSMDSGAVMAAADPWRRATSTLKQIRTALNTAAADTSDSWQGDTSNAFYSRMTELANSVNNVAAYSNDAANALEMMSEAIDKAKRDMPEEPGFWDKVGDAVSDTAQQTVGIDNEDTRTAVADSRKQEAVTVMQTLAASYRATTSYLKPPPPRLEDSKDLTPPDNGGASALGALIMGVGAGLSGPNGAGATGSSGSRVSGQKSVNSRTPQAPKLQPVVVRPTDAGISGGTANPVPQPKGPGTGIDGTPGGNGGVRGGTGTIGGTGGAGGVHGPSGGGLGTTGGASGGLGVGGGAGGLLGGGSGIGTSRVGFTGNSASKAGTFGSGGLGGSSGPGGGAGTGGMGARAGGGLGSGGAGGGTGIGARSGGNLAGKAGGVIGETTHANAGGRAFTEGGSGIGRNRFGQGGAGGQAGGPGQGGAGQGGGMGGHGQAGKKDKKRGKDRPDYLVEDEETWASGDQVNPNVVE